MSKTSVLIVSAPEGEKYTHACKWRIKCLTPDWIYDSVQRGHALPMENYEVKKQKHSTPRHSCPTSSECCQFSVAKLHVSESFNCLTGVVWLAVHCMCLKKICNKPSQAINVSVIVIVCDIDRWLFSLSYTEGLIYWLCWHQTIHQKILLQFLLLY